MTSALGVPQPYAVFLGKIDKIFLVYWLLLRDVLYQTRFAACIDNVITFKIENEVLYITIAMNQFRDGWGKEMISRFQAVH